MPKNPSSKPVKLTISRLANRVGVGVETIRYYQRIGLLHEPEKPMQGYRVYPETAVSRLRFIQKAKTLGFTLNEIADLLALENRSCGDAQQIAQRKLEVIQSRIEDLNRITKVLNDLLAACADNRHTDSCPIIDALAGK